MTSFISSALRFVFRLVFWLFATIFALSLLAAGLIVMALGLLKALITGKKPQPMVFGRFQRFSSDDFWPGARTQGTTSARETDVVDVEVREVREVRDDKRLS